MDTKPADRLDSANSLLDVDERIRTLLDAALDAVITIDSSGIITAWNTQAEQVFGWTRKQAIGRRLSNTIIPPQYRAAHEQGLARFAETGEGPVLNRRIEITGMHKDGREFPLELAISPYTTDSTISFMGFVRDITDRKQAEDDIRKLNEELELRVQQRTEELESTNEELRLEIFERELVEDYLRESEERFRLLVDSVQDYAIYMLDPEGNVASWNAGAQRIKGYTPEEIVGKHFSVFFTQEDIDAGMPLKELEIAENTGRFEEERWRVRKDGSRFWANVTLTAIRDGTGKLRGFAKVTRDLTARKQLQDRLATQANLIDLSHDAIIVHTPAGVIQFWNSGAESLYGWTKEEALGQITHELLQTRFPVSLDDQFTAIQSDGKWEGELEHKTKSGSTLVVASRQVLQRSSTDLPAAVLEINRDITARRNAEAEVRRHREELQEFVDSMSTMNAKIAPDGTLLIVNKAALQASGLSHEELLNTNFLEGHWWSFDPHVQTRVKEAFARAQKGEPVNYDEKLFVFGKVIDINFSLVPILDKREKVAYIVAEGRDITRLKQAEKDLQDRTVQLEAANKELEAFSYSVSHDLRAPLRAIDGFSQAILEDYNERLDDTGRDYLRRVRAASQRMAQLIDDLLNLSRVTRVGMQRETIDLSEVAQSVVSELEKSDPGRKVDVRIEDEIRVEGDPHLLRIALENLLFNAWKFTKGRPRPVIEFGSMDKEGRTVYFVRDNGAGFDMAYADRLFGAFQRLHANSEFPGTGIGLATVQRIIHRHGGQVWAEGKVDGGAIFWFTLQ